MKKIILPIFLFIGSLTMNAQVDIISRSDDFLKISILPSGRYSIGYQNLKYEHLTDIGYASFTETEFKELLTSIQNLMNQPYSNLPVQMNGVRVYQLESDENEVVFFDKEMKYTILRRDEITKLISFLEL